jgi:LuxR family transcriptional regulator, maltose regulon positive regulatory protein
MMRQKPAVLAKVARPQLAKYHSRERIYNLLDKYREYPVVWVAGPAGCGKTTLVNSYLRERDIRPLWYKADEGDDDPGTFFYYMGQALQAFASKSFKPMPLLTPEYLPGVETFTLRWFEGLFERMPENSVIVLDNYQDVPESSHLHGLLRKGFANIPQDMQVIIISREAPHGEFISLEANMEMKSMGWSDLRLRPEETAGIVETLAPDSLTEKEISDFHNLAEGWAAGIVLMVQSAAREKVDPSIFYRQAPEVIFDYFASEVFNTIAPSTREFLLKTAYLPAMSIAQASELTGNQDAGRILRDLSRHNYFIERRFHSDAVYSYHPLFREFLLARSRASFTDEDIRRVITDAAVLLERSGRVEDAFELIIQANDWSTLTVFLIQHGREMLDQGRHRSIYRILMDIPENIVSASPWLMFWMGASRFAFDPLGSVSSFEGAYRGFKKNNETMGFFMSWAGLVSSMLWSTSLGAKTHDLINDLEERKEELLALPYEDIKAGVASSLFGVMVLMKPEHPDIDEWYNLALELNQKLGNIEAVIMTRIMNIFYCLHMKTSSASLEALEFIQELCRGKSITEIANILVKNMETMLSGYLSMKDACLKAADAGLELASTSGIRVNDISLLGQAAWCCLNTGDIVAADAYIRRFSQCQDQPLTWVTCLSYLVLSKRALVDKDLSKAAEWVEKVFEIESIVFIKPVYVLLQLQYAYILHLMGSGKKARETIASVESMNELLKSPIVNMELLLIKALIEFDQGNDGKGLGHLRKGLTNARAGGPFITLWNERESLTRLCARALEAGIEVEYVQEIIRTRNLAPDDSPLAQVHWPWPVKICTLGRFEIEKDGEPVEFSKKAQKKPLEMLKTLISLGGSKVSEVYIADLLWPDADGDMAIQNCATTLHRLRKILGSHEAVTRRNGLLTLNPRACWVDAWSFDRLLAKAEELWGNTREDEGKKKASELTCSALDLYKGIFLPEERKVPDAMSLGEHLHDRYFKGLYAMCKHLVRSKQWEEARKHFERGLAVDDCAEGCYQGLMICLPKLGQKADALAVYDRCRRTLEAKLGIKPSRDTEALGTSLRRERA